MRCWLFEVNRDECEDTLTILRSKGGDIVQNESVLYVETNLQQSEKHGLPAMIV